MTPTTIRFNLVSAKIKDAIIANTDTKAVSIFQFLAAMRKGIFFQCENGPGNMSLELGRKPFEFLAGVAGDFDPPVHTRILSSFNVCRKDWRG
jgi:hypothetical protein